RSRKLENRACVLPAIQVRSQRKTAMSDSAPTSSQRQQEVFFGALHIADAAARRVYLDAACAGDPALRKWVEAELQKQTGASSKIASSNVPSTTGGSAISPELQSLFDALKP